jgi:hypothetical protein
MGIKGFFNTVDPQFYETSKLRLVTGKVLTHNWYQTLLSKTGTVAWYKEYPDLITRAVSPDNGDFTNSVFLVGGQKDTRYLKPLDPRPFRDNGIRMTGVHPAFIPERVCLLCATSEDKDIGVFGIWPHEFFARSSQNQNILAAVPILMYYNPIFWTSVFIAG